MKGFSKRLPSSIERVALFELSLVIKSKRGFSTTYALSNYTTFSPSSYNEIRQCL
jgi:hypothetical protein